MYMCIYTHTHTHTYTYTYVHTHTHTHIYVCVDISIYKQSYLPIYDHILYIYIYKHIGMFIYDVCP